jgi:hypothetical protein
MPVSKRTRYEVLKRDNHTCRYCGGTAPDAILTVDHVTPVSLGGSDDPSNLVAACRDCNYGKGSSNPDAELVEDVKVVDLRYADAVRRAAGILANKDNEVEEYISAFGLAWNIKHSTPDNAEWGLRRLFEAGLPVAQMLDAVNIATNSRGVYDRFNYFMGICWKRVTAIQETAKQILAAEEVE